jgi:hypothetical protein
VSESPVSSRELTPGLGHNNPPQPLDPIDALDLRLSKTHREMVVRFIDLELGCARVPNPLESEEDAAATTDFIAQCQAHIKKAEAAHRQEKEYFLKGSRIVDGFFKRRCTRLTGALVPLALRLKAYRDQIAERDAKRHEAARRESEAAAQRAAEEEAHHRAEANRLAQAAQSPAERQRAAEQLLLAEAAATRAAAAQQAATAKPEPTHIRGDYGSTAYIRKTWTFEVIELDAVPRDYMSLDVEVVREAINKDAVREIPGLRIYQSETLHVRGAA